MVSVDEEECIGCGACAALCEEVFEMKESKAYVKKGKEKVKLPCVKESAESCPTQAIKL